MITPNGYSKDKSIQPDGIVVTWSVDLIKEKGGLLSFIRYFEKIMVDENMTWLQKCRNAPKFDIVHVYIIVAGRLLYRCPYGGHSKAAATISNGDGHSWAYTSEVSWPYLILGAPFEKAPRKIYLRGFQGFRYCTSLW